MTVSNLNEMKKEKSNIWKRKINEKGKICLSKSSEKVSFVVWFVSCSKKVQ